MYEELSNYLEQIVKSAYPDAIIKSIGLCQCFFNIADDFTPEYETLYYGDFNVTETGSLEIILGGHSLIILPGSKTKILHPLLFDNCYPTKSSFIGYRIKIVRGAFANDTGEFSDDFMNDFNT